MSNKRNFTHRVAMNLIRKYSVTLSDVEQVLRGGDGQLWTTTYRFVKRYDPAQLGIICANGKAWAGSGRRTALYDVHCGTYLPKHASGRNLLRAIAATTLIALVHDILTGEIEA